MFIGIILLLLMMTHEIGMVVALIFPFIPLILSIPQFRDVRSWFIYYLLLLVFIYFKSDLANMGYYLGFWQKASHLSLLQQANRFIQGYRDITLIKLFYAATLFFSRYYIFIFPTLRFLARIEKLIYIDIAVYSILGIFGILFYWINRVKGEKGGWRESFSIIVLLFILSVLFIAIHYFHVPHEVKRPFTEGIFRYNLQYGLYYFSFLPVFAWTIIFLIFLQALKKRNISRRFQALSMIFILGIKLLNCTAVYPLIMKEPRPRYDFQDLSGVEKIKSLIKNNKYPKPIYLSYPQVHNYGVMMYGQTKYGHHKHMFRLYAVFESNNKYFSSAEFYNSFILPLYLLKHFENQDVITQAALFEKLRDKKIKTPEVFYDVENNLLIPLKEWEKLLVDKNLLPRYPAVYKDSSLIDLPSIEADRRLLASDKWLFRNGKFTVRWTIDSKSLQGKKFIAGAFIKSREPDSVILQIKAGERLLGEESQTYIDSFEFISMQCEITPDIDVTEISLEIISNNKNKGFSFIFPFILATSKEELISSGCIHILD
jgi:hypothetical protein